MGAGYREATRFHRGATLPTKWPPMRCATLFAGRKQVRPESASRHRPCAKGRFIGELWGPVAITQPTASAGLHFCPLAAGVRDSSRAAPRPPARIRRSSARSARVAPEGARGRAELRSVSLSLNRCSRSRTRRRPQARAQMKTSRGLLLNRVPDERGATAATCARRSLPALASPRPRTSAPWRP
jgi:hypothetical protein